MYTKIINNIHRSEEIPETWLQAEIKRLYEWKAVKGKCSNERGITLASNFGNLYERIINARLKKIIKISWAQAGGIEGNATVDHLITLKEVIRHQRQRKNCLPHIPRCTKSLWQSMARCNPLCTQQKWNRGKKHIKWKQTSEHNSKQDLDWQGK